MTCFLAGHNKGDETVDERLQTQKTTTLQCTCAKDGSHASVVAGIPSNTAPQTTCERASSAIAGPLG